MISFRLALSIGSLGLLAASLNSCLKAPEYSTTPSISFNNIQIKRAPSVKGSQPLDTIRITINYQDGDGDLGLTSAEQKVAPFTFRNPDSTYNKFNNNFFIEAYVRNRTSSRYQLLVTKSTTNPALYAGYDGAFGHPTTSTDSKAAPIKGTLTYKPIAFGLGDVFQPGDSVRFEVSIADRALHVSNTITTSSVYIAPR
jgi:hypothetical protein